MLCGKVIYESINLVKTKTKSFVSTLLFWKKNQNYKKVAEIIFWVFLGYESLEFSHFKPFEKYMYFSALEEVCIVGKQAAVIWDQSILTFPLWYLN